MRSKCLLYVYDRHCNGSFPYEERVAHSAGGIIEASLTARFQRKGFDNLFSVAPVVPAVASNLEHDFKLRSRRARSSAMRTGDGYATRLFNTLPRLTDSCGYQYAVPFYIPIMPQRWCFRSSSIGAVFDFCGGGSFCGSGWFAQNYHGQGVAKALPYWWAI